MSKTFANRGARPWMRRISEEFRCRHCRCFVGVLPSGGRHRNHCPFRLYSRHVDRDHPGDRASPCGGSMRPAGMFERRNGEQSLLHRCLSCGIERHNRVAADDSYAAILGLTVVEARLSRPYRRGRLGRTA